MQYEQVVNYSCQGGVDFPQSIKKLGEVFLFSSVMQLQSLQPSIGEVVVSIGLRSVFPIEVSIPFFAQFLSSILDP